jgi:hypothetical protein
MSGENAVTDDPARAILDRVAQAYRGFTEYDDAGFVRSETIKVTFETHFVRGQLFEFAFSGNPTGGELMPIARVTWRPSDLSFWTVLKGAPPPENLRMAIAALTGISSGAAHTAASLLLDEVGGRLPVDLRKPVLMPLRIVGGVSCREVRGEHPGLRAEDSLFVEEDSSLIRARSSNRGYEHYTEYTSCRAR